MPTDEADEAVLTEAVQRYQAGSDLVDQRRLAEARPLLEQAMARLPEAASAISDEKYAFWAGLFHARLADSWLDTAPDRALSLYHDAVAALDGVASTAALAGPRANVIGKRAIAEELLGDRRSARASYVEALGCLEADERAGLALAAMRINFGDFLRAEGELGAARKQVEAAIAAAAASGAGQQGLYMTAQGRQKLGLILLEQRELQAAFDDFDEARAIYTQLGDDHAAAVAEADMGRAHFAAGDRDQARISWEHALEVFERLEPTSVEVAKRLLSLGEVAYYKVDLTAAQAYFSRARDLYRRHANEAEQLAVTLYNLGCVHHLKRESARAQSDFEEALTIYERLELLTPGAVSVMAALGSLLRENGALDRAIALLGRAVDKAESIRAQAGAEAEREQVFSDKQGAYRHLITCLYERASGDDHRTAFAIAERSRARVLVELLTERPITARAETPAQHALLSDERSLRARLAILHRRTSQLRSDPSADVRELRELANQRRELEQALDLLGARMREIYPGYAALEYPDPIDLVAAQALLEEDTLLLEFAIAGGKALPGAFEGEDAFVWALRRDAQAMLRLDAKATAIGELVQAAVARFLFAQGDARDLRPPEPSRSTPEEEPARGQLAHALLGGVPAALWEGVQRIIVVPDGPLHRLPFDLLPVPDRQGQLLGDQYTIAVVPSATTLQTLQHTWIPGDCDLDFVGFGDPAFAGEQQAEGLPSHAAVRSTRLGLCLRRLEASGDEVQAIAEGFGAGGKAYRREGVTEHVVRRTTTRARFVHFATHGMIDDEEPLYSALALAPPTADELRDDPDLDDLLEAHEMFSLRLSAEAVVCSACRSGLGRLNAGEGMVGMARALFFAGARSVVVSLWSVDDEATSELMQAFYRHIQAGEPVALALQRGKADARKTGHKPQDWAAFQVVGLGW